MHSTSKLTCSDRTSATVRGSVMTGSGRTGRKATYRQQAAHTGAQRATASIRPEPLSLSSACGHGSPGWGETPLVRTTDFVREAWPEARPINLDLAEVVGKPLSYRPSEAPTPRHIDVLMHGLRHLR